MSPDWISTRIHLQNIDSYHAQVTAERNAHTTGEQNFSTRSPTRAGSGRVVLDEVKEEASMSYLEPLSQRGPDAKGYAELLKRAQLLDQTTNAYIFTYSSDTSIRLPPRSEEALEYHGVDMQELLHGIIYLHGADALLPTAYFTGDNRPQITSIEELQEHIFECKVAYLENAIVQQRRKLEALMRMYTTASDAVGVSGSA